MLEARGLMAIRGDRRLFTSLSFAAGPGEMIYVRGPNGSGKTTLLRMLSGLTRPAEGSLLWQGRPIRGGDDDFCRDLLYFGHRPAIKDDLDAVENLRIASTLAGQPIERARAREALATMGLSDHDDLPVKLLSQGQRRRVALARLLISRARLWILDEPFTALDVIAIEGLQASIGEHLRRRGVIVLTTHQLVELDDARTQEVWLGQ